MPLVYLYHPFSLYFFFFFNDTATTEIYTLSLHDALPIFHVRGADDVHQDRERAVPLHRLDHWTRAFGCARLGRLRLHGRSEEHTSELQSLAYLVCRLLLEKKKRTINLIKYCELVE